MAPPAWRRSALGCAQLAAHQSLSAERLIAAADAGRFQKTRALAGVATYASAYAPVSAFSRIGARAFQHNLHALGWERLGER
jgi:hypothetical protein